MVLRRSRAIALIVGAALAAGAVGCASRPTPTEPQGSPPLAATTQAATVDATASPQPSAAAAYPIRSLTGLKVATVPLPTGFRIHRMASDGPRIVYDELGYGDDAHTFGRTVRLADLNAGSVNALAQGANGDAARDADISGTTVAWVEWHYPDDNVNFRGPVVWRIVAFDLPTAKVTVVASGTNRMERGGAATPPTVHIDGRRIAYDLEDPTQDRPDGWKIVVQDLDSNATLWTVPTQRWLYLFDLSRDRVAWTEGAVDPNIGISYDTSLWLSDSGGKAVRVSADAFELALSASTLAWVADPGSSQTQNGLAQHPAVWETDVDHLEPVQVSAVAGPLVKGSQWVTAGDGFVAWSDDQNTGVGASSGDHLVVWSKASGSLAIEPTNAIVQGLGGGWLTWYDDNNPDSPVFHGIQTSVLSIPGS